MSIINVTKQIHLSFTFPDNRVPDQDSAWTQKIAVIDNHVVVQLFWSDKPYPTYQIEIPLSEWKKGMSSIGAK